MVLSIVSALVMVSYALKLLPSHNKLCWSLACWCLNSFHRIASRSSVHLCCMGPGLLLVMLSLGNTWGTQQANIIRREHTQTFPPQGSMLWLDWPCGSYYDCRMHFSKNHQENLRNKMCYSKSWKVYSMPKGQPARSWT